MNVGGQGAGGLWADLRRLAPAAGSALKFSEVELVGAKTCLKEVDE